MLSEENKARVNKLRELVQERAEPAQAMDSDDLSIPEGMQDDPTFIGGLIRRVDSHCDTTVSVTAGIKEMRISFAEFLQETKQLYEEELEENTLKFLEAASAAVKRLSKEQAVLKARVESRATQADLEFAEANDKVFKDALDALDFKLKFLSNKRKSLLGIVGTIRSASMFQPTINGPQAFAPRGPKDF